MTGLKSGTCVTTALIMAIPAAGFLPAEGWAETEEIIVSTRRREENLQEVPISVTAIGAEAIERAGIRNLFDVAQRDPSVTFDVGFAPSDTKIAIRGLSNTRGRSNAAFLIDGIDVTTENIGLPGSGTLANLRLLGDVERIEIVKGPQSALYGRSAFAGAISYTTKNPTDVFEGNVGLDVAEYNRQRLNGAVSGPLSDTLGYRVDGVLWNSDGFYNNSISGDDVGGGDGFGVSGTLVWQPNDILRLKARTSYSEDEYDPRPQVRIPGLELALYPQSGLDAGLGETSFWLFQGGAGDDTDFTGIRALGLKNHGRYCRDNPALDDRGNAASPGFCVVRNLGTATDPRTGAPYAVTHSENWRTGADYPGSTQDVFRATLIAEWALDEGTFSSYTGYTKANETDLADLDYEAFMRPDILLAHWEANTERDTTQLSQEFRFASNNEGPVNYTAGALFWHENRNFNDGNAIIGCLPVARDRSAPGQNGVMNVQLDPSRGPLSQVPGVCDGGFGGLVPGGQSVGGANTDFLVWQPIARQLSSPGMLRDGSARRGPGVPWDATTDHLSVYGMLEWQLNDAWKLTVEARYIKEQFDLTKPNQSSCDKLGFAAATGGATNDPTTGLAFAPLLDENNSTTPGFLNLCTFEDEWATNYTWAMITGQVNSNFITPKATVEWGPSDHLLLYFSVAKAQKPGGINQLVSGGSATTIEAETFEAEKMIAYEAGGKTTWDAAGYLRLNWAAFFQDYTDKQVGTQVLIDGRLTPRVTNASSAEVRGLEFDAAWSPDAVDGLTLTAAYTWLDPTFSAYIDDTKSLIRAAQNGGCPVVYKGGLGPNPTNLSDPANGDPFCRLTLTGNDLELTARNAFVAAINVTRPLGGTGLDWIFSFETAYQDKRFESQDNFLFLDEYWLSNVRLGVASDRWDVLFYVDNVFDDDTLKTSSSAPDFGKQVTELGFLAGFGVSNVTATLPDPQVFGVRANFRFGGS